MWYSAIYKFLVLFSVRWTMDFGQDDYGYSRLLPVTPSFCNSKNLPFLPPFFYEIKERNFMRHLKKSWTLEISRKVNLRPHLLRHNSCTQSLRPLGLPPYVSPLRPFDYPVRVPLGM